MKPRDSIIEFLEHLPDTIRADIAAYVLRYAFDEFPTDEGGEFVFSIKAKMEAPTIPGQMGRVLSVISVVDYALKISIATARDDVHRLPFFTQEMSDSPKIQGMLEQKRLRLPLRLRHLEAASADWTKLRNNELSFQGLAAAEEMAFSENRLPQ